MHRLVPKLLRCQLARFRVVDTVACSRKPTMNCIMYIDGGSRGNPGPAAAGVVIRDADGQRVLHEAGYFVGTATSNVAEYRGLIRGLRVAEQIGARSVCVHSDSQLLVRQVSGQYRVKAPSLKPLFEQVHQQLLRLDSWKIHHVRREQNRQADQLVNMALDATADVVLTGEGAAVAPRQGPDPSLPSKSPCWSAELDGPGSRCLAGCGSGNEYTFGLTTPEGFCIHAAAAVFADGPLQWHRTKRVGRTRCLACGRTVKMSRLA
mgnify:CR=1 FL=1